MSNKKSTGGVGFMGLLTILFIGLKLTNYIMWSWFWVLSPIIIPLLIGIICGIILLLANLLN